VTSTIFKFIDASEFAETGRVEKYILGQNVPCPHCGKETTVYIEDLPNEPQNKKSQQESMSQFKIYTILV
jgi:phage terminase large subunit GpA-like protein